ncbi:hypothetical protein GDO86_003365, partial [Hymenochirus boettgeri]
YSLCLLAENVKKLCFGSTQDRKLFPSYCAPDRLGNDLAPIRGSPNLGPGCYNFEEVTNLNHFLETRPISIKGYTMGARTAPRIPQNNKAVTPGPGEYQSFWTKEHRVSPAYVPFFVSATRFPNKMSEAAVHPRFIDDLFFIWHGSRESLDNMYQELNGLDSTIRFTIT